jgi:hypothetical protein
MSVVREKGKERKKVNKKGKCILTMKAFKTLLNENIYLGKNFIR